MVGTLLLRTLANHFAFPVLMTVVFVLLLLWLCRIFRNTVVTDIPNNHQHPPAAINLRNVAVSIIFLFLIQAAHTEENEPECNFKLLLTRLNGIIRRCASDTDGIEKIRDALCSTPAALHSSL